MGRSIASTVPLSERKATYTGVGALRRPVLFGDRIVRCRSAPIILFAFKSFKSILNFSFSHFSTFELFSYSCVPNFWNFYFISGTCYCYVQLSSSNWFYLILSRVGFFTFYFHTAFAFSCFFFRNRHRGRYNYFCVTSYVIFKQNNFIVSDSNI